MALALDRLLHPALGHSDKVQALSWFERCVWFAYELTADDYGVMRFSAITIQNADDKIAEEPTGKVQKALERLRTITLLRTFQHQGRTYCFQDDWQRWQKIRHPRQTLNPLPPSELWSPHKDAASTRQLWQDRIDGKHEPKRKDSRDDFTTTSETISETFPKSEPKGDGSSSASRAPARGQARNANANANGNANAPERSQPILERRNNRRMNHAGVMPLMDSQFSEFVSRVSPKYPDREAAYDAITAWMNRVDDAATARGKSISGDPFKWWQARFDADWNEGSAEPVKSCRHRHDPPCENDSACTAKYLRDQQTGVGA